MCGSPPQGSGVRGQVCGADTITAPEPDGSGGQPGQHPQTGHGQAETAKGGRDMFTLKDECEGTSEQNKERHT